MYMRPKRYNAIQFGTYNTYMHRHVNREYWTRNRYTSGMSAGMIDEMYHYRVRCSDQRQGFPASKRLIYMQRVSTA